MINARLHDENLALLKQPSAEEGKIIQFQAFSATLEIHSTIIHQKTRREK